MYVNIRQYSIIIGTVSHVVSMSPTGGYVIDGTKEII